MNLPKESMEEDLYNLISQCLQFQPDSRPTFQIILSTIDQIKSKLYPTYSNQPNFNNPSQFKNDHHLSINKSVVISGEKDQTHLYLFSDHKDSQATTTTTTTTTSSSTNYSQWN